MLKKTITYTNPFTEQEVTEDYYFHISKADLVEMEVSQKGGMAEYIQKVVAAEDGKTIMAVFKDMLRRSYGLKEGDRFVKTEAAWEEFVSSEAYSNLFFELCTNADAAAEFVNGIIPKGIEQEAAKLAATAERPIEHPLVTPTEPRLLTEAEVREMNHDELKSGLATGRYKLS